MQTTTSTPELPRPRRAYLVCATQRSGSTLLCHSLAATGIAGRPEEFFEARRRSGVPRSPREWFADAPAILLDGLVRRADPGPGAEAPPYSDLRAVPGYRAHLERTLRDGTTPNGVFGAKVMWNHLDDVLALAASVPEVAAPDPHALFASLLGDPAYVWVRRRDDVPQAISLWRAIQTHSWRSGAGGAEEHELTYSHDAIAHLLELLRAHDRAWGEAFAGWGVTPLELEYEAIAADPGAAVRAVLDHAGIPGDPGEVRPRMRRQADELSERWIQRFHEEAAEPAAASQR